MYNIRVLVSAQVSILEELAPFERFKIAEAMEMRTYNDGEIIIAEGDPGLFQKSEHHFRTPLLTTSKGASDRTATCQVIV